MFVKCLTFIKTIIVCGSQLKSFLYIYYLPKLCIQLCQAILFQNLLTGWNSQGAYPKVQIQSFDQPHLGLTFGTWRTSC